MKVHESHMRVTGFDLSPTPLVPIRLDDNGPTVWCKCEFMNPSGSTKDRIAAFILNKAFADGVVERGDLVAEVSSGSTSIAMAMVCARLGLKFIAIMPEGVSRERVLMIQGFGGEVRFTPKSAGMQGAADACCALARSCRVFLPRQFENIDNAEAHRLGTAVEIAHSLAKDVDASRTIAFTSGIGTGGTMVGMCSGLREHGFQVKPFAVRPIASGSHAMSGDCFGSAEQCSFSARIPGVLDGMSRIYQPSAIPDLCELEVSDDVAMATARALIRQGFPVGPSSGLNVAAAIEVAKSLPEGTRVVTILCDRMERYFSTELFTGWS